VRCKLLAAGVGVLALSACTDSKPPRALTARELRAAALDSLARLHPCAALRASVLYDHAQWKQSHACAIAAGALEILRTTPAHEPYHSPGDISRTSAIAVHRTTGCHPDVPQGEPISADSPGHVTNFGYLATLEIRGRLNFVYVEIDAKGFSGRIFPGIHPRGIWGSEYAVAAHADQSDSLEIGARCVPGTQVL
jgi:hypothetical protein